MLFGLAALALSLIPIPSWADSVNSPNITLNVDTNRSTGPGAGGVALTISTVTIAETILNEYSAGAARAISFQARPGFQFDPTSDITAQSATIGFNGQGVNVVATITPTGAANEVITFELTSGTSGGQDIVRVNGIKVLILNATGAAGPAQTTLTVTTVAAGGAFTNQGIVAANITRGAADRLVFSAEPGTTQTGGDLLPAVKIVDFGGNLLTADPRTITLTLQNNPAAATLLGITALETNAGVATWVDSDDLRITTVATGYTLRASHGGAAFLTSDTVESSPFDITAGPPDRLVFSLEPADTTAGSDILVAVTVQDSFGNTVTTPSASVTLDSAVNPGGWPLLVDSSLTKATVNGVATWDATDNLRINRAIPGYRLLASGVGAPVQSTAFDITAAAPSSLRFVQQPSDTQEGSPIAPPVSVEIVDAFLNRVNLAATIDLILRSACGGTLAAGSATSNGGLATFASLRIDTPCANIAIEAATANLPRATSDPFTVSALPPVALRFVQQPIAVEQNVALNPLLTVEIIDAAGNRTDSAATVELTLLSSCGGALSTTTVAAVGGLATFAILSIDTPCTAVTLQATSADLTGATSDVFDIAPAPIPDVMDGNPCGACGQGSLLAMAPLFTMLVGMKFRLRSRRR